MNSEYILTSNGSFIRYDELYHWGIKGMRWGVRRYQNEDGSLTNAGKKRYYDTKELNKQKSEIEKSRLAYKKSYSEYDKARNEYFLNNTPKNLKRLNESKSKFYSDRLSYKKNKLTYDANKEALRIKDKGLEFRKKSKHRLQLEDKYKKLGMTEEQAQAAANKRIRVEKILAASAGITVSACAAYAAVKYRKNRIDGVIKAGESLQRVEMRGAGGKLHEVFYASKGDHDNSRYAGMLGFTRQKQTGEAWLMKLQASEDIKVASRKNAERIFGDLYRNDPDFRSNAREYVKAHFNGSNKVNPDKLTKRNIAKMYENFNSALIDAREGGTGVDKKFYNALKTYGYGAIQDVNDMKFSGYKAKNPLIIFGNHNNNIRITSTSRMTGNLYKNGVKEFAKAKGEKFVESFMKTFGGVSMAGTTAAAVTAYRSDPINTYLNSASVQNYKNTHPGTRMSDYEIYKMITR